MFLADPDNPKWEEIARKFIKDVQRELNLK